MSPSFEPVFDRLRALMLQHAEGMTVTRDRPGDLVIRTPVYDARGEPGWFGMVAIKKSYVAYHLLPLYERPEMVEGLPLELERRRQGKTCFNFKSEDEAAFAALSDLTARVRAVVD